MKLNIFSIPSGKIQLLKDKFFKLGLKIVHEDLQEDWRASFFLFNEEETHKISWVEMFPSFLKVELKSNRVCFGAYFFEKGDNCFVLSFGKAHFYIRSYCDRDFGVEVAKRLINEYDTRQTASKKFAGKKKKEIRSYHQNSSLNIESGESVDYINATIINDHQAVFGTSGKFAESVMIAPILNEHGLGIFFNKLLLLVSEKALIKLPRIVQINDSEDIDAYDAKLLSAIKTNDELLEFADASHDIVGVDFIFNGNAAYTFFCKGYPSKKIDDISSLELLKYIQENSIADIEIFNIKIKIEEEGCKPYFKDLKCTLEFIVDDENVALSGGRWMRYNEDYLQQLNDYIDSVYVEVTEDEFKTASGGEPGFNSSEKVKLAGYINTDKNFTNIAISSTPTEGWDLEKGDIVYAVKFGTTQKLNYVIDQATSVNEIRKSKSIKNGIKISYKRYCLWLFFELKSDVKKISQIRSIIFRQKIEHWARSCRNIGVEPCLKFSRKV